MNGLERALARVEAVFATVTVIVMLAIMAIVSVDVVLRYLFHSPLSWAFDLIGLYLMAAVFFLSLSATHADNGHVGVDLLLRRLPESGRRVSEIITCLVALPFFAALAAMGAGRAIGNYLNHDTLSGLIAWPTWIAAALVPLGSGLMVARLSLRLVGQLASLASGRAVVELMPLGGHDGVE